MQVYSGGEAPFALIGGSLVNGHANIHSDIDATFYPNRLLHNAEVSRRVEAKQAEYVPILQRTEISHFQDLPENLLGEVNYHYCHHHKFLLRVFRHRIELLECPQNPRENSFIFNDSHISRDQIRAFPLYW
jgi:hypothetical protein